MNKYSLFYNPDSLTNLLRKAVASMPSIQEVSDETRNAEVKLDQIMRNIAVENETWSSSDSDFEKRPQIKRNTTDLQVLYHQTIPRNHHNAQHQSQNRR